MAAKKKQKIRPNGREGIRRIALKVAKELQAIAPKIDPFE